MMERSTDTIFAPAGPAVGTITIVRLSGPRCRFVLETLTGGVPPPRRASLRALRRPTDGEILDRALVIFFPGPDSFTGEDCAELHLHGGRAVLSGVVASLSAMDGLRPAGPGEFTRRAFLNGRMDVTEAEGLADLITAETDAQRRQALQQMDGVLGTLVRDWSARLTSALALAEAELDFSDERDVSEGLIAGARRDAAAICGEIRTALAGAERGRQIRDGYRVVIAGPPNAGKSSLLNAIAQRDVAIVSDVAGTTRDLIEVRCDLGGYPVTIVDTAGLRDSDDAIERIGVARAERAMVEADLVIALTGADQRVEPIRSGIGGRSIRVRSKSDLLNSIESGAAPATFDLSVSVTTGEGIAQLLAMIREQIDSGPQQSSAIITRERHRSALLAAAEALADVDQGDMSYPELVAEDIRRALDALASLLGERDRDAVLDLVFGQFCIGK